MRLNSLKRAALAVAATVGAATAQFVNGASAPLAGLPLADAIAVLERDGLRVFYSTDLVRPWMHVEAEPEAADAAAALAEILAPLGLATQEGPGGSRLVIRAPGRTAAAAPMPQPAAEARAAGLYEAPLLDEIIVAASQYELRRAIAASQMLVTNRDLEYLPDVGDDAIRAVSWLPGTASNGVSARANVRGGEITETLVRFDGLRLYDPFHLKDFQSVFSVIDPRIVSAMNVYTGGFPAAFGDRMSSVIDVETLPAPEPRYHELGFSFFNSSFLSSGEYAGGRGEWLASLRRSNLDLLYAAFSDQPERPRYTDAFVKLGWDVSERLRITGNVLRSEDDLTLADDADREEHAQADHRDQYAWLRLDHAPGTQTTGKTLIAHAELDSRRSGTSAKIGVSTGSLVDVRSFSIDTVESDWSTWINDDLLVHVGGSVSRVSGRYDYEEEVEFDLLFAYPGAPTQTARSRSLHVAPRGEQYAVFATLRYDWTERLAGELGIRWDMQTLDAEHSDSVGPRLGVRYALSDRTDLRMSWGRFYQSQAINELQVSDGVGTFFEPQRSGHLVVGIEHEFEGARRLRVEAYEKSMDNLRPRFENILNTLILLPELKPDRLRVAPASARAVGLELMVEGGGSRPLRWWSAYSWSRVRDHVGSEQVLRSWDQTHALSAGVNWDTAKWNVSAALIYRSGWPTTPVALDASGATPYAVVPERNGDRLGFYRSLDLRLTRKVPLESGSLSVSFELTNVLGRSNPCCLEYEIGDEEELGLLVLKELDYLPRIPSIGLLWKF